MARREPPISLTHEDIDRLWDQAARPGDYPSLRAHSISLNGEPAELPADVIERAQRAGAALAGRRGRRGRPSTGTQSRAEAYRASGEAIYALMDQLDIPDEAYEVSDREVILDVPEQDLAGYPDLPAGYGYKGGVVRKALARTLRLPISTAAVRDIDLLRGLGVPGDHDRELAERYMTEDLILGDAKVEAVNELMEYYVTREVTINQSLLLDGQIRITHLGFLDTLAGVIRVTRGHLKQNFGRVHPIVTFKVLRFAANLLAEGREPIIPPFRVNFRRRSHPFAFFFALQLSRAYEYGPVVADHYVELCRQWNLLGKAELPDTITGPEAAAELNERLADYHLHFEVPDEAREAEA
jgi:hypothetical protein